MPASTFEILSQVWEDKQLLINSILTVCLEANLYFSHYKGEVTIKFEPFGNDKLILEIRDQNTLKWYYDKYPLSKEDPEERIPYFVRHTGLGNRSYKSIALANNYFNDFLIWEFATRYLNKEQKHIIALNREIYFDSAKIKDLEKGKGYSVGWCFKCP